MPSTAPTPRTPRTQDLVALIGLLASLEAKLMAYEGGDIPEWAEHFAGRLTRDGLLKAGSDGRQLRQSLNDLNHRLRYVLGEYDELPESIPVP